VLVRDQAIGEISLAAGRVIGMSASDVHVCKDSVCRLSKQQGIVYNGTTKDKNKKLILNQ
jgi:hypothetical protein